MTSADDDARPPPVRGVLLVAGALTAVVVVVALLGGPRPLPSADETAPISPVLDERALSAWCQRQPSQGNAESIGGSWECAWVENGFFRHASVGDGPCQERFGPSSRAAAAPDGLRCSTS